jgi:hypothetical protein
VVYGKWLENFEGKSPTETAGREPGSVLIGGAFKPVGQSAGEPVRPPRQAVGLASARNRAKMPIFSLQIGNKL